MELDITSGRTIRLVLGKYHVITNYRYKREEQRFKIILYCHVENGVKKYPYMFVTEKQLIRDIINKFRGKKLFKIFIEPHEYRENHKTEHRDNLLKIRLKAWGKSLKVGRFYPTNIKGNNIAQHDDTIEPSTHDTTKLKRALRNKKISHICIICNDYKIS
ncbi:HT motif protein [Turkeypox virus]|uniref:HT motif protein n=1 Tax=Turkeypox virus TaxID=336486 RepID=A0A0M3PB55_9POXV|nr:HT motif protein [Turkeypox virus]ALA62436.1 HT motif protein [Turkeypox virus]